jgi:hypothetical protein
MNKNSFLVELIKSGPFKILIIVILLIILGVVISNRRKETIQMKEDVLYLPPKTNE